MNAVLKIFLSMSFSGGLLILALLLGKRFLKDKISRQWQYYIWLVVVLRLLLPFGPEVNLLGKTYQAVDQAITQAAPLPSQRPAANSSGDISAPAVGLEQGREDGSSPAEDLTTVHPIQEIWVLLTNHIWLVWLVAALGLLIRKVTVYQAFMRYIKAGLTPVSDLDTLDRLSIAAGQSGIQKPVELCVNPLVSSPLLIGFFRPCIVLPGVNISEQNFQYTVLHELTHYRRRDMFYKWLVQITVCLHWFNPLVYLMSREVTKACEFSCDEAVLAKIGCDHAQDYGKTLLDAMAAVGRYKENPGAVTLSENKQLLKERLGAIMKFKAQSKAVKMLTVMLTLCVVSGAAFVGVYSLETAHAASLPGTPLWQDEWQGKSWEDDSSKMETLELKGKTYYLVANETQLRAIGTARYGMDLNYMQQADIALSAGDWVPIGTWDAPFTGTYNGNGF
ncbi:MAG: M56 family metallopeptidase, partial [Lachnospiraceae bacterium]|nr:M56 family metallopeptidase [Lachnospiraceae bacterium]